VHHVPDEDQSDGHTTPILCAYRLNATLHHLLALCALTSHPSGSMYLLYTRAIALQIIISSPFALIHPST
jgi:hypothetical protein